MRPLFVDFPDDESAWTVDDEFLFGPDILVAPISSPGQTSRHVYLPAGTDWVDAWTGERYEGASRVDCAAPLERIPVFTRAGSDLHLTD